MSNSEDKNDAVEHMMDGGNVGESEVVHRSSNDDAMDAEMDDNNNNDEPSNDDDDDESMDSNDSEGRNWDPYGFYEEAFDMLKSNDREADFVELDCWEDEQLDFLQSIDWEEEGSVFRNNTRLKVFNISCTESVLNDLSKRDKRMLARSAKLFFRSLSGNRSIRNLSMEGCIMDVGDAFSLLSPFIENNIKLRSFIISNITLNTRNVDMLVSALSKCNNSLKSFGLNACEGITAGMMENIIDVVGLRGIQTLYLDEYDMDEEVSAALGGLSTNSTLNTLSLGGNQYRLLNVPRVGSITATGMVAISSCLSNPSTSLEKLSLNYNQIGEQGALALARGLVGNSTLKKLDLSDCDIGTQGGIALARALENNTTLEELDLYFAVSPGREGWVLSPVGWAIFFDSLKNCALRDLNLGGNTVGDEQITPLVEALDTMTSLATLNLRCLDITPSGWITFFSLMLRPGCIFERLGELNIYDNDITDDVMISIANALVGNTSLMTLDCFGIQGNITEKGWSAISDVMCNKRSIRTISDSNHTFCNGLSLGGSPLVNELQELNKGTNKAEVVRRKIVQYYFLKGEGSNLHELIALDLEVLPHVIECFGRYDHVLQMVRLTFDSRGPNKIVAGLELLYRLTRAIPSLFGFRGKALGGKRKRLA